MFDTMISEIRRVVVSVLLLIPTGCIVTDTGLELIYVVGAKVNNNQCQGFLWVNGEAKPLTDASPCANIRGFSGIPGGRDIVVSGAAVFVVGIASGGSGAIWKDGDRELLPNIESSGAVIPRGVHVEGELVYVIGYNQTQGLIWRNGDPDTLARPVLEPGLRTKFEGISVLGEDFAVAGSAETVMFIRPAIWLNGVPTMLDTQSSFPFGEATGVNLTPAGVYVSGTLYDSRSIGLATSRPVYWHDGVLTVLGNTGVANAIAVEGDDVYVAGRESIFPVYWKNGEAMPLFFPPEYASGSASDIFVIGDDVFVAGQVFNDRGSFAAYWKNNVLAVLDGTFVAGLYVRRF